MNKIITIHEVVTYNNARCRIKSTSEIYKYDEEGILSAETTTLKVFNEWEWKIIQLIKHYIKKVLNFKRK